MRSVISGGYDFVLLVPKISSKRYMVIRTLITWHDRIGPILVLSERPRHLLRHMCPRRFNSRVSGMAMNIRPCQPIELSMANYLGDESEYEELGSGHTKPLPRVSQNTYMIPTHVDCKSFKALAQRTKFKNIHASCNWGRTIQYGEPKTRHVFPCSRKNRTRSLGKVDETKRVTRQRWSRDSADIAGKIPDEKQSPAVSFGEEYFLLS